MHRNYHSMRFWDLETVFLQDYHLRDATLWILWAGSAQDAKEVLIHCLKVPSILLGTPDICAIGRDMCLVGPKHHLLVAQGV